MVLGFKPIKLANNEEETTYLVDKYYWNHRYSKCLGGTDGTHIAIKEPINHYTDFINRKGKTACCE